MKVLSIIMISRAGTKAYKTFICIGDLLKTDFIL